ncbi:metallophosphoesterase [Variovorax arabinosiphilus]|uniref:metallophosphoesterase n=1 Tax=Variovorax arabinosiphilus TaxID=3053498 RepID=UPI00257650DF|nr:MULTISPECIES: metallophosphoesterase [unclassified Variovorax]MDM0120864.1 metallophosphoesterase [Variovorax sp. J2L1-78]MDM0127224.1 metallophosphoesterase [Variovorax sp. J2L1-63]MDM0236244.1 metallophosphoesterase [Variovorax sp. J2R1-6]
MSFDSSLVNSELGKDDKCVTCNKDVTPRLPAVILYPNLGCPLVLAPGQTRASIVIGVSAADATRFAVNTETGIAQAAHPYIDRHLRLYGIDRKETDVDTSQGNLFGDGRSYETARTAVTTRWIDFFDAHRATICSNGMAFSISAAAVQFYREFQGGKLFEIDIDLSVAPFSKIGSGAFHSFAWMVELTEAEKKAWPGNIKPKAAHYQDLLINRFLTDLPGGRGKPLGTLHEFDVNAVRGARMDAPSAASPALQAWHPVIRATAQTLQLGHLSDVHVSVRHDALARSPAALIEDADGPDAGKLAQKYAGDTLCNAFSHLKTLFETIGASKKPDTALLLTGDLIDFNRNIDPRRTGETIGAQWKAFNILSNIHDSTLYPRWQDDMLVFSLVRHAYTHLKLPVFITTGNHEAYEMPYGISPRMGKWGMALGAMEVAGRSDSALNAHRQKFEEASAYASLKANAGIAADHNLTLYEATLAYGPTYGQLYTGLNFNPVNFDWFGALFNPLGDFVLGLGGKAGAKDAKQLVAGLAWGGEENFQNMDELRRPVGVDRQGTMILPRAAGSFSQAQKALLQHAQKLKQKNGAPLVVASHFTLFSYDQDKTLSDPHAGMTPADDPVGNIGSDMGLGPYNMGTCERNLKWYFDDMVLATDKPRVDWHLSGHSHRAGVYQAARAAGSARVNVRSAKDPGLHKAQTHDGKTTHFVVSSCGGPIGYQNLDDELKGWTLRPPAGSVVDTDKKSIRQIASAQGTGRPRLCVALDYLHVLWPNDPPLSFRWHPRAGLVSKTRSANVTMVMSEVLRKLDCVGAVKVWVFEGAKDGEKQLVTTWHCLTPALLIGAKGESALTFSAEQLEVLARCMVRSRSPADQVNSIGAERQRRGEGRNVTERAAQAFCEVVLKKPPIAKGQPDWSEDMNVDDHWLFPLDIGTAANTVDFMHRRGGEHGEVPDWKWLYATWGAAVTATGNTYPDAGAIVKGR